MLKKILFCLIFIACSSGNKNMENKYDKTIAIPEKQMISILTDYHLAEGINAVKNLKDLMSLNEKDSLKFLDSIVIHHGFSKKQFDTTMRIYISDMAYYSYIYEKVMSELSRLEGENNKKPQPK
jgi:hypothetical protein